MREHYAEFDLFKGHESSYSSLSCGGCDIIVSDTPMKLIDKHSNDP